MPQKNFERLVNKVTEAKPIVSSFLQHGFTSVRMQLSTLQKELDEFFKITDVKEAQHLVTDAERKFLDARRLAGLSKKELEETQLSLKEARKKLDRCPRDSEYYLAYVSEEHSILINEQKLRRQYEEKEQSEREFFTEYSNAVRISHEKERERAQKTKYWSIIGSVSGTIVGFLGSSLITYYRLKQIKQLASPDIIINELRAEIHDSNKNQVESQKLFEENTMALISSLGSKIPPQSSSKEGAANISHDLLGETERIIKDSESEIKQLLNSISSATKKLHLDFQTFAESLQCQSEMLLSENMEEQNSKLDEKISNSLDKTTQEILKNTKQIFKHEFDKFSEDQRSINQQISSAQKRAQFKEMETLNEDQTVYSIRDDNYWKSANLAVSLLSFGLLLYVVLTKN